MLERIFGTRTVPSREVTATVPRRKPGPVPGSKREQAHVVEQRVVDYLMDRAGQPVNLRRMGKELGFSYNYAHVLVNRLLKRGTVKRGDRVNKDYHYEVVRPKVYRRRSAKTAVEKTPKKVKLVKAKAKTPFPSEETKPAHSDKTKAVLSYIRNHQMIFLTQKDMAQALGVSTATVSNSVRELESDKTISRSVWVPGEGTRYSVNDSDIVEQSASKTAAPEAKLPDNGSIFINATQTLIIEYLVGGGKNDLTKFCDWLDKRNKK